MCKSGYLRAEIYDANLNPNIVCLQNFCGLYGKGTRCDKQVGLKGCDKSTFINISQGSSEEMESCLRCSPGHYLKESGVE